MHSIHMLFCVALCSLVLTCCHGLTLPSYSSAVGEAWSTSYAQGAVPTSTSEMFNFTAVGSGVAIPLPSDYFSTVLFQHNVHRANHSAGPLTYDMNLACEAVAVMEPTLCPASPGEPGNLFTLLGTGPLDPNDNPASITAKAVLDWYNEEPVYAAASQGYTVPPDTSNFDKWGHFSQMMWAGNTAVGCWATPCSAGSAFINANPGYLSGWIVGCKYSPGGNVGGAYTDNVFAPLGQPPIGDELPYWNDAPNGSNC